MRMFAITAHISRNMIVQFHGAIADISVGWALCDGTLDTPDLRGLFIIGAGGTFDPDDTGGNSSHKHGVSLGAHAHDFDSGTEVAAGEDFDNQTETALISGETDSVIAYPPYYALAYIMKL